MSRRSALAVAVRRGGLPLLLGLGLLPPPAWAFDAATTHAGLTEQALSASSLRLGMGARFGWEATRLGQFQPLALVPEAGLRERLARIDPASNAAPSAGPQQLTLTAGGWLLAGAIVEEIDPARAAHHRFDPTVAGGGPSSSVRWMNAPDNDLSLARFLEARERSLSAVTAAERDGAAALSLLAAGALLHLVEDAAEPAYVHGDVRVDLLAAGDPFAAFVAERFGRFGLPAPAGRARPLAHLADAIHAADGSGLADRTAARFYSLGLLSVGNRGPSGGATRPPALPPLAAPAGAGLAPGDEGYVEDGQRRKLARYQRSPGGALRFSLDEPCYQDAARALLPEAAQAALSALEHLFRGGLQLAQGEVRNGELALGPGTLRVLIDDDDGKRRELASRPVGPTPAGASLGALPPAAAGRSVLLVFRGVDGAGEPLVVGLRDDAR